MSALSDTDLTKLVKWYGVYRERVRVTLGVNRKKAVAAKKAKHLAKKSGVEQSAIHN